jgi:hypothetical protein
MAAQDLSAVLTTCMLLVGLRTTTWLGRVVEQVWGLELGEFVDNLQPACLLHSCMRWLTTGAAIR